MGTPGPFARIGRWLVPVAEAKRLITYCREELGVE